MTKTKGMYLLIMDLMVHIAEMEPILKEHTLYLKERRRYTIGEYSPINIKLLALSGRHDCYVCTEEQLLFYRKSIYKANRIYDELSKVASYSSFTVNRDEIYDLVDYLKCFRSVLDNIKKQYVRFNRNLK